MQMKEEDLLGLASNEMYRKLKTTRVLRSSVTVSEAPKYKLKGRVLLRHLHLGVGKKTRFSRIDTGQHKTDKERVQDLILNLQL